MYLYGVKFKNVVCDVNEIILINVDLVKVGNWEKVYEDK